jgi:endonuclease/exonuclease/phosphatase family metal-dependent hydrolase
MGRTLLTVVLNGGQLAISSAHFESLGSAHLRRKQLAIAGAMGLSYPLHIICGDFNFGDGMENASLPAGYDDLWPQVHPEEPGALTWDREKNPTILLADPRDTWAARCDRILVKQGGGAVCQQMAMLGTELSVVVAGDVKLCPSDHFGLEAHLTF